MTNCRGCGHIHKEKDCRNAQCLECGCSGDLTRTPKNCVGMKELNKQIEMYLKVAMREHD